MVVTASGAFSLPLENLRTLVAASSTFQTWVGDAGDASAAKEHIYKVAKDGPTNDLRPFAIVRNPIPADLRHEAIAGGARNHFEPRGALELYFEANVATADAADHGDAELAFLNTIGDVLTEMESLSASGTYLAMTGWQVEQGPVRAHPDEGESGGDCYQVVLRVEWGT